MQQQKKKEERKPLLYLNMNRKTITNSLSKEIKDVSL